MSVFQDFLVQDKVAYITRLYQAGLEYEARQYAKTLDADIYIKLYPWASQLLLGLPENTSQFDDLPDCLYHRSLAWTAYYHHHYLEAHERFIQSASQNDYQQFAYDTALGLCRIYTRSGHWQIAQRWAIYYLSLARKARDDFALTKGYGALAELFLRAGCSQEALACFQYANGLMPVGQGQQDKQYNFIASALIRNKEYLRAENLLHSSKKISKDKWRRNHQDKAAQMGYLHSLARLHFLLLEQEQSIRLDDDVVIALERDLVFTKSSMPYIPLGFLYVASGIFYEQRSNQEKSRQYLYKAKQAFTKNAPMEYQWVSRLLDALEGNCQTGFVIQDSYQDLLSITPISPPSYQAVLDKTWADTTLPKTNGFAVLSQPHENFDKLVQLWRNFFL